jgi:hypothetical protein
MAVTVYPAIERREEGGSGIRRRVDKCLETKVQITTKASYETMNVIFTN